VRLDFGLLAGLDFLPPNTPLQPSPEALVEALAEELNASYADPRHRFGIPLCLIGTPYRRRVWAALQAIPAGQTVSYGELARRLDSAPRAVGQAVGDNPVPILVPCHRVLGATGLGGFMHRGDDFALGIKRWLLRHEGHPLT